MNEEKPVDPLSTILERTKDARLVLINEGHDDPQSRSFIIDLLEPLRREGFTQYAAETFYDDIRPSTPRWPRLSDGYYSREPVFGELLRRARSLQYVFVPYEKMEPARPGQPWQDRLAARETAQAQNLIRRVLKVPGARALVHAGYSHVSEDAVTERDGTTVSWMAKRLKSETGIDPLTIDQTRFVSPIDRPVLCALHDPAEQEHALPTDLTIGLPPVTFRDGRPAWRQARGHKPVAIPDEFLRAHAWLIVEARYASEPDDAVPADRLLVGPDEKLPLILPPASFALRRGLAKRAGADPFH